jgi:hypothetical protein
LAWHSRPPTAAGWYLTALSGPAERLAVDPVIDALAHGRRSNCPSWEAEAALAAALSTALALDVAERRVNGRPARATGRFRRLRVRARVEIYVTGLDAGLLRDAVPELALEAVSEVTVLAGSALPEAREAIARRLALLGGRVVAVFVDDAEPEAA